MSAKFSEPANDSRKKFMLVYQAQTSLLESVHQEHLERSRHERFKKAAIKDADLLIKLWSALSVD